MRVNIAGPDYVGGGYQVHAAGCRDLARFRSYDLWELELEVPNGWPVAVAAAREIWCDHPSDYGWNEKDNPAECRKYWEGCALDVRVMPCCKG